MKIKTTSAHWGSYYAKVKNKKLISLDPYEKDANPSLISEGMIDAVNDELRIKNPYVRAGWYLDYLSESKNNSVAFNRARKKRGTDEFIQISWTEAIDIVSKELNRVKNGFTNKSIFAGSYGWASAGRFHHAQSQLHRFFNCFGGYVKSVTTYSYAASETIIPHVIGMPYRKFLDEHTDWNSISKNTDVILMFGSLPLKNSQVTSGGVGFHTTKTFLKKCKKRKVKFFNISPTNFEADKLVEAEWVKIRPGTDTAFMLGLAYLLETNNQCDREFLRTRCYGYDKFKDYLLGTKDGIKKDPNWAQKITGLNKAVFYKVIDSIKNKKVLVSGSWSLQRQQYGEQPHWMIVVLASMIGQIGKSGGGFGLGYSAENGIGNPVKNFKWPALDQFKNQVLDFIPVARYSDMLLNPGESFSFNGQTYNFPDIKLVYWAGGNPFHHQMNLSKLRKATFKPDTIITNEIWWNSLARHSDIILPTTTSLERNDIGFRHWEQTVSPMHKVIDPVGNSKNDYEIFSLISKKLGFSCQFTENKDEEEWLNSLWNKAKESAKDNNFYLPDFKKFWDGGFFEVLKPTREQILLKDYIQNPKQFPLSTPSQKIEIFSDEIDSYNYFDCPGHPSWLEPKEWLGSVVTNKFPLHLISGQPENKLHSQLDNSNYSKKFKIHGREALLMSPTDAKFRNLKNGEVIKVFNERGSCLAGLKISKDIMNGVVFLPVGAWYNPHTNDDTFCIHGNPNVLTDDIGCSSLSQGPSAHSTLVEIIKWDEYLPTISVFDLPKIKKLDF